MSEEWRAIDGFEGLYEVSNFGNVKALDRYILNNGGMQHRKERILKPHTQKSGHLVVVLCKDGKTYPRTIHRLVADAFIPNPENKPVVDHIDTNPANNNVGNLRWVTVQENCMNPLTRIHNSESKKGHKCYLKHHSEETKRKLSEQRKGRKLSEEHKKKLSESHKNSEAARRASINNIKKANKANIGTKRSEETRQKIREKSLGRFKEKHWKMEGGKRVWY